ncbi:MAG: hypothetical protein ACOH17_06765 [Cellulomonas sp.]
MQHPHHRCGQVLRLIDEDARVAIDERLAPELGFGEQDDVVDVVDAAGVEGVEGRAGRLVERPDLAALVGGEAVATPGAGQVSARVEGRDPSALEEIADFVLPARTVAQ